MMSKWIGVDLDGTLAYYDGFVDIYTIGRPIPKMVARVKSWLAEGKEVRIVTARMDCDDDEAAIVYDVVRKWCREHIGQGLEVTCIKGQDMEALWDDRAVQVVKNTGVTLEENWCGATNSKNIHDACDRDAYKDFQIGTLLADLAAVRKKLKIIGDCMRALRDSYDKEECEYAD